MLFRRKLWAAVVTAAILFLMFASQSIQRRHFMYMSVAPPLSKATPINEGTWQPVMKATSPAATLTPDLTTTPPKTTPNPSSVPPEAGRGVRPAPELRSCGCDQPCVRTPGPSQWFSERFEPQQEPVLQSANSTLDPLALQWWLGLQRSKEDQTLEEVVTKLFQVVPPPTGDVKPHPSQCRTCAVVGNSGNLQNSRHGRLINSHTSVIRMNKAMTRGFEEDVGNRTTHHFLYPESAVDVSHGVSLVLLPFKLRDLEWLASALSTGIIKTTYMRVKDRVQADKDKVLVVNPVFFNYVHEKWTEHHGRYPSTGMLAIIFALHICDQVSVFGYGADQQGNWHHYWEKNRYAGAFRKTGVHSAEFETQVIQRLAREGKISLHL